MTSGSYMGIVGVYLMLFGMLKESEPLNRIGLILATVGFFVSWHFEDEMKYRLERLEKKKYEVEK